MNEPARNDEQNEWDEKRLLEKKEIRNEKKRKREEKVYENQENHINGFDIMSSVLRGSSTIHAFP